MFFLSHASNDAALAKALARGLKEAGIEVWFDQGPRAMEPGQPFPQQLEQKLQESRGLLLLVGKRGVNRWVRLEVDVAVARNRTDESYPVVPLLLPEASPSQLPPFVARFHALQLQGDITRWGSEEFQALASQLASPATTHEEVEAEDGPFPGLESFEVERARFYFGRDREIRDAVARLGQAGSSYRRWLEIEGPSGVGKSSFVKAGLVPAIRWGWMEGAPERWRVAVLRPGRDPVLRLARELVWAFGWNGEPGKLTQVAAELHKPWGLRDLIAQETRQGEGFLLVVDQLEEVFTLSEGNQNSARHLDELLVNALESDGPLHLVTTLRSDFLGRLEELPRLSRELNAGWTSRYYLNPLDGEGLRQVLSGPAQRAGLRWEEGLPGRILQDAEAESGGLPLVAHVLRELWKRRSGRELMHSAYEELGRVGGALTRGADSLLSTFSREEQERVRKLLLALVKVGRGMRDARRPLTLAEAREVAGGGEQGQALLARLSGGRAPQLPAGSPAPPRLLSVQEERVELIHEALLEQWKQLRDWLEVSRKDLERRDALEAAALLWENTHELPGEAQLQYLKLAEPVSTSARAFLAAVSAHEHQRQRIEQSRELAAFALQAPSMDDPQLSLLLILEAHRLAPSEQTTEALLTWFLRRERLCLGGKRPWVVSSAVFSPDGQRILTGNENGTAYVCDARSGRVLLKLRGHSDVVGAVAFSPDGQRLLTGSWDGTARLWDAASGRLIARLSGHAGSVNKLAFSPEGRRLLTASEGGTVRLWDASDGHSLRKFRRHTRAVNTALFSRDGSRVLAAGDDGLVFVWDIPSEQIAFSFQSASGFPTVAALSHDGQRVLISESFVRTQVYEIVSNRVLFTLPEHVRSVNMVAFSPDGQRMFLGAVSGSACLCDANSGELLTSFHWPSETVLAATFSPEGFFILTARGDMTLHLRDGISGEFLAEFRGHEHLLYDAAFLSNNRSALSVGGDGTAHVWETSLPRLRAELHGVSSVFFNAECSPDGQRILAGDSTGKLLLWNAASSERVAEFEGDVTFSPDGQRILATKRGARARLWDSESGRPLATLYEESTLEKAIFNLDGQRIFTAHQDGTACVWDGTSGQLLTRLQGHVGPMNVALFSPDSQYLLTGTTLGKVCLWKVASGQLVFEHQGHFPRDGRFNTMVTAGAFSPDGKRFLTGGGDRTVRLWETASGRLLAELGGHHDFIDIATFSPDGQRILTSEWEGTARIWSTTTRRLLARLDAHTKGLLSATFSPDGRRLLTSSADKTARLWDAASGHPLAELRGHSEGVRKAVFSPNGRFVLTASRDQTARIWNAASGQCVAILRGHSGPSFSASFSPTGQILTSSGDGTLRLWDCELFLPTEALCERARAYLFRELTEEERRLYLQHEGPHHQHKTPSEQMP